MAGLTREFLTSIGVEMDDATFVAFSDHFDETLHQRVIDRIMHDLSEEQVSDLASIRQAGDDLVWQWLQTNVPKLGDIVRQEVDKTLAEIVRNSDHL